jgi:hypothetical protein
MKDFLIKALLQIVSKIVEQLITDEMLKEWEQKAKEFACDKLDELAAQTAWTEIDDILAQKIRKAWLG